MNEKLLTELKGIYTKLGGEEDLAAENSLIVILDKIYKQMGGEKDLKQFSIPEVVDLIEDEVGGGGSSDFSTAEITFINNNATYRIATFPTVGVVDYSEIPSTVAASYNIQKNTTRTFTVILYKGVGYVRLNESYAKELEGDVEQYDDFANELVVTGDCTVTFPA